jgi:hypothetical protein
VKRRADLRLPAPAFQLSGDDLRIIEDQNITRAQQGREIADAMVLERRITGNQQQSRRIAGRGGPEGDALWREIEVE